MRDTTERRVTAHDIKTMAKEAKRRERRKIILVASVFVLAIAWIAGLFWMLSKS